MGGYFFVERPEPTPRWLNKVFDLLYDEGWQGHFFNEIRVDCRGEIKVVRREDFTAVIDERKGKVFHNSGMRKGSGKIEDLEEFEP